ncbi:ATP-dependent RNA helicase rhlE [Sphingobacterium spiritivorum]|uniref:ATP-dependent RNA helicase rhlE n=1 Tax=Sphingobacterium spiritivorum TaxID=258 RepID=A0A380CMF7_SPHSI|nr:DEAD/DEAH box helicase [Sphingobacterium spiritivorum]SUJ22645.1 ATP-dependent RNA helicase rhlE [Sphingobacterium spiritivorum]
MNFQELNLSKLLIENLNTLQITEPTGIQKAVIPNILKGKDVLAISPTGTGKTEAFVLPVLHLLTESKQSEYKTLVLSPTRELAQQTYLRILNCTPSEVNISTISIFGGQSYEKQAAELSTDPAIVVATPGRLLDLMDQKLIDLSAFKKVVIDEADELLQLGFMAALFRILGHLPADKQTLLFSATFPKELEELVPKVLHQPFRFEVQNRESQQSQIHQYLLFVDKNDKKNLIKYLIDHYKIDTALIFTRTTHGVDRIVSDLQKHGLTAQGLYGDKSQAVRTATVEDFKNRNFNFLVATDIASRGLHLDDLDHVINYEIPDTAEQYMHRIGRTARGIRDGYTYTFCDAEDNPNLIKLQIALKKKHPYLIRTSLCPELAKNASTQGIKIEF